MSTRKNGGFNEPRRQHAADLREVMAQTHGAAAEAQGEREDQAADRSRSRPLPGLSSEFPPPGGESADSRHEELAAVAYGLWEARGCPAGSPEEDWFQAARQLQEGGESSRNRVHWP